MSGWSSPLGRRRFLAGAAAPAVVLGTAGCVGDATLGPPDGGSDPDELAVRFGESEWIPFDRVETGKTHRAFYHPGGNRLAPNPKHGYGAAGTLTFLVHRSAAIQARAQDALVITYNVESGDAPGGSATLSFDESVAIANDVLVFDNRGPDTGDSYSSNSFTHAWNSGRGDGVVVALLTFDRPTFRVEESEGIDLVRVVTGDPGDPTVVASAGPDTPVTFNVPTIS